ncbi:hypothetical protein BD311DRAFT_786023 [Dichomitus squalens]|uniref:WKF domain-containing protein n=1 Tax=Dichomitus squalens TaxID=114155 RepID=A0A4Q9MX65_9APHY|nr:hypothetical protein BD311DRAFT_786023 [Dichomitus squalens]
MSTASPDKPPRKNKKNREPLSEADPSESEKPRKSKKVKADKPAATSSVDTDASHPLVEPEKTEKKKKRKHAEEEGAVDFSKSTKKHKHGEAAAEKSATGVEDEGEDGERRRKKRKKHAEHPDGAHTHQKDAKGEGKADGDVDAEERPATTLKRDRKKKDKKKRKDADDGEEEEGEAAPKKKGKKKRKRSSASGFPDPTEDESLSEQARKALEYAFTQFEDPGSWKFHKARQNWLIRNIWSEEAIPDTYIPLATRYLQGVQGGARETLVKTCQEALQPPQLSTIDENTLARDEASSSKPVQTKEPTDAPLKTKRTVKFTVEGDNAPADSINDTKRQRAATLLAALTS